MDTISVQKGQWIPLQLTFWADREKTAAVDLSGAEVTVCDASDANLKQLSPVVSDAAAGIVELQIGEEVSRQLSAGRTNWLTVEAQFASSNIVVPRIWINVHV